MADSRQYVSCLVLYLSPLGLLMEQSADVSKPEDDASSNGLAGISAAEQAIWISHHPVEAQHCLGCTSDHQIYIWQPADWGAMLCHAAGVSGRIHVAMWMQQC